MTMKVDITNDDLSRTLFVREEEFNIEDMSKIYSTITNIPGKTTRSFYVHASKRLVVREDPDAQVEKK